MANRFFNQFGGTLERKVVKLFAKILYTGGAPTLVDSTVLNSGTSPVTVNESQGFESLVPGNSGFQLVLGNNNGGVPEYDTYVRLLNVSFSTVIPSGGIPGSFVSSVIVQNDNVNGAVGGVPTIDLITLVNSPSAPPPPFTPTGIAPGVPDNGTILYVELTLSNTTAY